MSLKSNNLHAIKDDWFINNEGFEDCKKPHPAWIVKMIDKKTMKKNTIWGKDYVIGNKIDVSAPSS